MVNTFVGKEIQKRRIAKEPDFLAERLIKEVKTLDKDCWQVCSTTYYRSKDLKQKPYLPEGFIELDGVRFKVKEIKTS